MSGSSSVAAERRTAQAPAALEPIAVIGMGCRFPGGANDPDTFWRLLKDGVDAVSDVPPERWSAQYFFDPDPATPGKTYARRGGFLADIDRFDAQFFGIAPREAAFMDPQQRLLLEVCWEALEDAGQVAERLSGSETGVFVGISTHDYGDLQMKDLYSTEFYANTGGALSIAANRLSYVFNLRGPSVAVDTACSSSLVAVHLACRSLWDGDCGLAIVGGVNCILSPETTITFSKASMLSPDGRCKSFDAAANGYVRGEGAGVVVLKRLSQALADGDPIYTVVLATAVNQDGRTPGMTMPNVHSQEALLRDAYRRAGVSPADVFYVEAHGTGTPVGDPIEAQALGTVLGAGRPEGEYLRIGSVKSNIGHLEAASGMAGLIKAALVLRHRELPASLHFQEPNPRIAFEELRLRVQDAHEPWRDRGRAAVVGVNSFGFGGTNAHVVLQEPPARASRPAPAVERKEAATETTEAATDTTSAADYLLPLSARSRESLLALARDYAAYLPGDPPRLADVCYTAAVRRSHHEHRLALVGRSAGDFVSGLEAFVAGASANGAAAAGRPAPGACPKLAFVFSGMGPQWWGMGRGLQHEPVFREAVERCDELFRGLAGWSVLGEMAAGERDSRMREAEVAQPANFVLQVGLSALWAHWGVVPDAVVGHSAGEVAAACAAGALSLEDAVRVIFHRSRLQQRATCTGKMLAVGLAMEDVSPVLADYDRRVSIAAVNSPRSVTLSGDADALQAIAGALEAREVFARFLDVKVPYHSHHMDPLEAELRQSLADLQPRPASRPLYSTVTGGKAEGTEFDASYWWWNVRKPVNFAIAIEQVIADEYDAFVEVGPHPALMRSVLEILAREKKTATVLPSLRRENERRTLLESAGTLYTVGRALDWRALAPAGGAHVKLPAHVWQKERHWHESETSARARLDAAVHPLLERKVDSASAAWETVVTLRRLPYLEDHRIQGSIVYPAAAYVEMGLAAAGLLGGGAPSALLDVEFKRALTLQNEDVVQLQLTFDTRGETFEIHSRVKDGGRPWTLHATGRLPDAAMGAPSRSPALARARRRCATELEGERCYEVLKGRGLHYGPRFQGIETLWHGDGEAVGRIRAPERIASGLDGYWIHPAILDACLQVLMGAILLPGRDKETGGTYLPVKMARVRFHKRPGAGALWTYGRLVGQGPAHLDGDLWVFDEEGGLVLEVTGLRCQRLGDARSGDDLDRCLYELKWLARALPGAGAGAGGHLPRPAEIAREIPAPAPLGARFDRTRHYGEVEPQLERLCAAYALEALRQLGWRPRKRERVDAASLGERLGVTAGHRRLLGRFLEILCEEGLLEQNGSGWVVSQAGRFSETQATRQALAEKYPDYDASLALLGRCGPNLAAVLRGEQEPLSLVFPDGSMDDMGKVYEESPYNRVYNFVVEQVVAAAVRALPKERTLRVLEIGAGTGGTTARVLPVLPPERTEYVFTDVSQAFMAFGAQRFRDHPFVEYRRLDIEQNPEAQGFAPHSFDLILAADALHATRDLRESLGNVKRLLSSEGLLVVMELIRASRVLDLIFGLLKDWWRFEDVALRQGLHPWLSRTGWERLLAETGFGEVAVLSDAAEGADPFQAVFVARGPRVDAAAARPAVAAAPVASDGQTAGNAQPVVARWLILADRGGVGDRLAMSLRARGDSAVVVAAGESRQDSADPQSVRPDDPEDMVRLLEGIEWPLRGIVHLWSLDAPALETGGGSALETAQRLGSLSALHVVQALEKTNRPDPPRLWLVTRGAQNVGPDAELVAPGQAPLWGLGRVIASEQGHLRCTLVDLDPAATPTPIEEPLVRELSADDAEQEIGLRGEARYVARLVRPTRRAATAAPGRLSRNGKQPSFELDIARPGILDSLVLRQADRKKPGPGEVEIQAYAAGLNFRDVMKALGMYPTEGGEGLWLGDECAGRVVRVGKDVGSCRPGDEVVALAPGTLRSFVTVPADYVLHKPAHLSFEEAATLPIVFLTSLYALKHVARLAPGERVLIHSAAGGVGLAAVQIAQQAGAEIFATAGSPEKREFLKSLGLRHVMDSRTQSFVDEVRERTGGNGVSVVLNSLAGEFLRSSLSLLEPTGRFLELGKIDIYQDSKLGLARFKKGLSFCAVDLGWLLQHRPALARALFVEVMDLFQAGKLRPLPVRTFPISDAAGAFRHMAQAKHIGKIALSMREKAPVQLVPAARWAPLTRRQATYLVTGGLTGFGLSVAKWLVAEGARHLVLVGRRGIPGPEAEEAVAAMREAGAHVHVAAVDVSREDQVASLMAEIGRTMPPLRGIFHAAMVLDDGYLIQLNQERFARVMAPKVAGAWNLHVHSLGQPIDFFVSFSSVSSLTGAPGQGNYAAANAFLDALAHYRRGRGLPALTVNWGAIAEVGYVARNADVGRLLDRQGVGSLRPSEAETLLERLLRGEGGQVGAMRLDFQRLATSYASSRVQRVLSCVLRQDSLAAGPGNAPKEGGAALAKIRAAEPAERSALVESLLRQSIANVLKTSAARIEPDQPLGNLGLDSLMAVELEIQVEAAVGADLSLGFVAGGGTTLRQLAKRVLDQLVSEPAA